MLKQYVNLILMNWKYFYSKVMTEIHKLKAATPLKSLYLKKNWF